MALTYACYVYCLIEREFLVPTAEGRHVVKMGMTRAGIIKRLQQYPNGSVLLCTIPVRADCVEAVETAILAYARKKFTARVDIGREYFDAPPVDAIAALVCGASGFIPFGGMSSAFSLEETNRIAEDISPDDMDLDKAGTDDSTDGLENYSHPPALRISPSATPPSMAMSPVA